RQALALVLAVLAVAAVLGLRTGAATAKPKDKPHKKVCTDAPAGAAECHAEVVTKADGVTPDGSVSPANDAYGPADLQSAYALPGGTAGSAKTIAIVDALDNPNAESDLAAYRIQYGLAPCTAVTGGFRKVN